MRKPEKWKIWFAASFVLLMGLVGIKAGFHYSIMMIGSAALIYIYLTVISR